MKAVERGAPAAAILAAVSALACCLPLGIVGGLGLASISIWLSPLRPWLLGAAVFLLALGLWQIYRRGKQCGRQRGSMSVALFWVAVAVQSTSVRVFVVWEPMLPTDWYRPPVQR